MNQHILKLLHCGQIPRAGIDDLRMLRVWRECVYEPINTEIAALWADTLRRYRRPRNVEDLEGKYEGDRRKKYRFVQ